MFFVRGILMWFVLMALMFINGACRELVTGMFVGERTAEVIHIVSACLIILLVTCGFCRRERGGCVSRLGVLGVIWAMMTVAFETILIVWIQGDPLREVASAYDITRGELWPVVVLTVLLAPVCAGLVCRRGAKPRTPGIESSEPTSQSATTSENPS